MKTDVLVIGSSAAGLVAAMTAKSFAGDRRVTVVRSEETTLIPCGIPYTFSSVESTEQNILPSGAMFEKGGVDLVVGLVTAIDPERKVCELEDGSEIAWEKLVMATGSTPIVPAWLPGADLPNVFTVPKDKVYLDAMHGELEDCERIVVIGAGFIGVEISDELAQSGKEIVLVEKLPNVLGMVFDEDMAAVAEATLIERGVQVRTGVGVKTILGDGKATGVELENGETIPADAVVLSIGYHPCSELASAAGLAVDPAGFVVVDEYMRTSCRDVFAVGDCAQKTDFVTRRPTPVMLASTACAEARIAGINLYKLSAVKTFSGTISIFSTALGDTGFGVAGLTEARARAEGFDIVVGSFEGIDRHPGKLPGAHSQRVKLIVGRESGVILGGEVVGGLSAGELTNTLGFIIQGRMNVNTVFTSQIGTHPLLTSSPVGYPLLKAAGDAAQQVKGLSAAKE